MFNRLSKDMYATNESVHIVKAIQRFKFEFK